jgi:hypothetical protein
MQEEHPSYSNFIAPPLGSLGSTFTAYTIYASQLILGIFTLATVSLLQGRTRTAGPPHSSYLCGNSIIEATIQFGQSPFLLCNNITTLLKNIFIYPTAAAYSHQHTQPLSQ